MSAGVRAGRLLPVLLFAALAAQVGAFILTQSNTFDEPAVIGAGAAYVRTGRLDLETKVHPPLMKYLFGAAVAAASPSFNADSPDLRADRPYAFGLDFLFHNRVSPEVLLALARLPGLLLSLALAACVFLWARRWFGPRGGVLALAAYAFEPNLLAHSGLANMDLALTAFLFAAYYGVVRWLEEPSPRRLALAGALAGAALSTKLPGVFFFAWSAPLILYWRRDWAKAVKAVLVLFATAALVLLTLYQFRFAPKLGGLLAQMLPAIFVPGHPTEQHFNFLLGQTKTGGWRCYYLVALATKAALPFLALAALGFWKGLDKKERVVLGVPVLSWLIACSLASKQNGLRYILPVFPFLCLAVGSLARLPSRRAALAVAGLLFWAALECLHVAPDYLAYFNELAGGPDGGYRVLVDSNLDWGQDFREIGALLRANGNPEIIVAVLGDGDRDHYFGPHQDLAAWEPERPNPSAFAHVNSAAPKREWLIVSASLLQGFGLGDPQAFAWLRGRPALARPGHSTFVYDVTSDGLAHYRIGGLYARAGRAELARREFLRSSALEPAKPHPWLALGDLEDRLGRGADAAADYRKGRALAWRPEDADIRAVLDRRLSVPSGK